MNGPIAAVFRRLLGERKIVPTLPGRTGQPLPMPKTLARVPTPAPARPRMVPLVRGLPWQSTASEQRLRTQESLQHEHVMAATRAGAQARGENREALYDEARRGQRELRRLRTLIAASQGQAGLTALDTALGKSPSSGRR